MVVVRDGIIKRLDPIFGMGPRIKYGMSQEEVDGLIRILPPQMKSSLGALMVPRTRDAFICVIKGLQKYISTVKAAHDDGKKVILHPFNFPPDLIYSFEGAVPLATELLNTMGVMALDGQIERYIDITREIGLPDSLCTSGIGLIGSLLSGLDVPPDAIISAAPGSCDNNAKLHEFAAEYMEVPIFHVEKPADNTERSFEAYKNNFREFVSNLEDFVGEELDEERLRDVMKKSNMATEYFYELNELRSAIPCPVPNAFSFLTYGTRYTLWGTDGGIDAMRRMVEVSEKRRQNGYYPAPEERARTLWIYTGYYYDIYGLFNWMEEHGITYLNDLLGFFFPMPVDTSDKESMIDAAAGTVWNYPMTRQVGADFTAWVDDSVTAINELHADCAIFCGHPACKQTWGVFRIVRDEIRKQTGNPTLRLQADAWDKRMTPITTVQDEIENFVKTVVESKKPRKPRATSS